MVWQLFHMGWPWDAPCEKARLPGWLAWQGWLAGLAGCLVAGLAGGPGWLAGQGWLGSRPGWLAWQGWLAWPGRAGWLDGQKVYPRWHRRWHHGGTLTFTTVKGLVEGYTITTYAGALNTNY